MWGVGLTHVSHLEKSCRRRLCTPPTGNFPSSTLNSPQAELVESDESRDIPSVIVVREGSVHLLGWMSMLVTIAIHASNARGVLAEHSFTRVEQGAPGPYVITALDLVAVLRL